MEFEKLCWDQSLIDHLNYLQMASYVSLPLVAYKTLRVSRGMCLTSVSLNLFPCYSEATGKYKLAPPTLSKCCWEFVGDGVCQAACVFVGVF